MALQQMDANAALGQFYQRLVVLEQELVRLKIALTAKPPASPAKRAFISLRGAWAGLDISEEEIAEARIRLPEL